MDAGLLHVLAFGLVVGVTLVSILTIILRDDPRAFGQGDFDAAQRIANEGGPIVTLTAATWIELNDPAERIEVDRARRN